MNPYRFFSVVFSYPTEETMRELKAATGTGKIPGSRCAESLGSVPLEEVQAEYTRLFISAYPRLFCPPYESFYREGIVYGATATEVAEIYRRYGLNFICQDDPPDLLSAELDFLAITNSEEFLGRLKEWIFTFTEKVKSFSKLYGVCAGELEDLLRRDYGG